MTTLTVGIASYEEMKARTLAIVRGEHKRTANEPTLWFTSIEAFAAFFSEGNQSLLTTIAEQKPGSLDELARLTGRCKSNLSRTLRTMEGYGLVQLERGERGKVAARVPYDRIVLDLPLTPARSDHVDAA